MRIILPMPAPQTRPRRLRGLLIGRHLRRPHRPRALPLRIDALLAPEYAVAVRVAVRRGVAPPPMAALGHARVADKAVAVGASRLVAVDWRRDRPLGRMEVVERAERTLVR
jgi:hypothetical protein